MHALPELNDERLYDLLEAGGEQARASVHLLGRSIEEGEEIRAGLAATVNRSAQILDDIRVHLVHATLASLPKAEVEALARAIAAIAVDAERFAERLGLAGNHVNGADFAPALNWIDELAEIVIDMTRLLRGFESLDRIKDLQSRLETVADHAEAQVEGVMNLAQHPPAVALVMMKVKDVADQLIRVIDRCREAGGIMNRISMQFL